MVQSAVAFTITAQDQASSVMQKVQQSTRNLHGEAGVLNQVFGRTDGARKFSNALENMAFQSAGVTGKMGTMLQGLSSLSVGSPVMLGLTAGIVGLVGLYKLLASDDGELARAKKKADDLTESLVKQSQAVHDATGQGLYEEFNSQKRLLNKFVRDNAPAFLLHDPAIEATQKKLLDQHDLALDLQPDQAIENILKGRGDKLMKYHDLITAVLQAQQNLISGTSDRPPIVIKSIPTPFQYGARTDVNALLGIHPTDYSGMTTAQRIQAQIDALPKIPRPRTDTSHLTQRGGGALGALDSPSGILQPDELTRAIQVQEKAKDLAQSVRVNLIEAFEAANIGMAITDVLSQSITAGFSALFSGGGIGGAIAAFGKAMLAGLGGVLSQLGDKYLQYGLIMLKLSPALANPFTSAGAAIAIGLALKALGGALGGIAQGGSGGQQAGGGSLGGGYGGGYYSGSGSFSRQPGTIILNLNGAPYLDLRDPETRDKITGLISEVSNGTRQLQYGGGVSRA